MEKKIKKINIEINWENGIINTYLTSNIENAILHLKEIQESLSTHGSGKSERKQKKECEIDALFG